MTMESITQKNLFLTVVIQDFNARLSKWWTGHKTTQEGLKIENLLCQFSLSQVINKPTHISQKITIQQNLITDLGVHPSLHSNCPHQIIYIKFNLRIFYPPLYERHIWYYKHTNADF